ncbi:hypothetical protein ACJX0J_012977, partial [Zea mays]
YQTIDLVIFLGFSWHKLFSYDFLNFVFLSLKIGLNWFFVVDGQSNCLVEWSSGLATTLPIVIIWAKNPQLFLMVFLMTHDRYFLLAFWVAHFYSGSIKVATFDASSIGVQITIYSVDRASLFSDHVQYLVEPKFTIALPPTFIVQKNGPTC